MFRPHSVKTRTFLTHQDPIYVSLQGFPELRYLKERSILLLILNESYGYIQSIFIVVNKLQSRSKLEYERAINQENKIKHTPVQFLDVRRL